MTDDRNVIDRSANTSLTSSQPHLKCPASTHLTAITNNDTHYNPKL